MLRLKLVKNGTIGAGRISSVVVGAWLIFGWSRPAFPDEQPHLKLAPIEFRTSAGGNIGYTFQRNTYGNSKTIQQLLELGVGVGISARSFFWQPWLVRVTGQLDVYTSTNTISGNMDTNRSGNTAITGASALSVLPSSRFPFKARVYRSNNQTNGFLSNINSDYTNTGLNLIQEYRSKDGRFNSLASFTHDTRGRASFSPEDVRNQLNLTLLSEPLSSNQTFQVVADLRNSERPLQGDKSSERSLVANHSYQPNPELSVASFGNLIKTSNTIAPSPTISLLQSDYNSQQLSSFSAWRPEGSPLTMTGSARILRINSSSNGVTTPTINDTNLNLGANYAWSPLLRMYGSVNVNDNNGIQNVTTDANLSAQKGFGGRNVSDLGGFRYSRSVGASIANTTTTTSSANQTTTTTSVQSLGGSLGHDLSKKTNIGSGLLNMEINQGLSTILSTATPPSTRLNTGGSLSWHRTDIQGTTIMRLTANDSRSLSNPKKFSQLINLQASRNENLGHDQSLVGNLTLQGSRSGGGNSQTTPFIAAPSAELMYRHSRLFKVKNLDFDSILQVRGANITSSQDSTSQQNTASISWDNDLHYFIGRLTMQLKTRLAEVSNILQSSILFNVNRSF